MTGGAAFDASSGFRVLGRWRTQTLSFASMAMLEGSPSFHCGGTFGHERSTSNVGKLWFCAYAVPAITNRLTTAHRKSALFFTMSLLRNSLLQPPQEPWACRQPT